MAGSVQAKLSWRGGQARPADPRLRIVRDGQPALDVRLSRECTGCDEVPNPDAAVRIVDLDGDGEPEVLVDAYSGGAHCCFITPIYGWTGRGYRRVTGRWGDPGYELEDLDGDRKPEFVSGDGAFAYAFTAFAFSFWPAKVDDYAGGRLVDRTRSFPRVIRANAARALRALPELRRHADPRGAIAAYVADQFLLGRRREALRYLDRALRRGDLRARPKGDRTWPSGRAYRPALLRLLRRLGYDR